MKKLIALFTALVMVAAFAGCGSSGKTTSDLDYVKDKGTLVVGITDFEPMDYQDENGKWIGFDADMATKFAEYIGVDVKFVEIDWDNKTMELDGKSIDCVWNGMTLTDDVKAAMSTSNAYCNNAQIVIVPADKADQYKTAEDCKDLKFAVEDQATAVMEVASGTSEADIIDSLMAAAMVGEGTSYENLAYTVSLNSEEYGVGFRKDSDLTAKLNEFFDKCKEDGTLESVAETYKVQASLIK